uniref:Uncharacterized protein n=1 Tax=Colwellia sp. C1 TaxID=1737566 RepID=A0A161IZ43_9GAMM|nr:hypothetical protein [Colwellia sp. C1]
MLGANTSYLYKFIALVLTTLIIYWLISIWNITIWQQVLLEKTTENQPSKALKQMINNKGRSLVFTNVDLPELPKKTIDLIKKNAASPQSSIKKTKQPLTDKQPILFNKQATKKANNKSEKQVINAVNKDSTSAIYQQLVSDNSINIELAWPNESSARQGLFTFLYQCLGMKFGVLNNKKVTLAKTFYQNVNANDEQQPSEWLRIAQGQLASQERLWLQQYHLSGTPVRLFPKVLDWQLAKFINIQLNGKPLKSLRAFYKYDHQRLMLNNIRLNGQWLSAEWTLTENKCAI